MFCCAIGINNDEMGMFVWCSLPNQYGMCVCVMQFSSSWLAAVLHGMAVLSASVR